MKILKAYPPNYRDIVSRFPVIRGKGTYFSFGETIYAPRGGALPPELIAHEKAHGARQLALGIDLWWDRYLAENAFRLDEEIIGHRAEYQFFRDSGMTEKALERNLMSIATRLSGPVYGKIVDYDTAYCAIRFP